MVIRIGVFGYGLATIFGAGAVLLATLGNPNWKMFAFIAVALWILSVVVRRI